MNMYKIEADLIAWAEAGLKNGEFEDSGISALTAHWNMIDSYESGKIDRLHANRESIETVLHGLKEQAKRKGKRAADRYGPIERNKPTWHRLMWALARNHGKEFPWPEHPRYPGWWRDQLDFWQVLAAINIGRGTRL